MKKWVGISITAAALLSLTLAGCGSSDSQKSAKSSDNSSTSAKKQSHHKKATKTSSSSESSSSQSSQSSQSSSSSASSASSASSTSASSTDNATHPGIPAALIGTYQETEKSDAAGFASTYEFTATSATYSASNMPAVVLNDVSYKMVDGNYVISGTGEPAGMYKGGPETWTLKQDGNKILRVGYSTVWAVKQ